MSLTLIWAEAHGVLGRRGRVPWRLPEDLARFRELTWGGAVAMGRATWESLPPAFRPLPGRQNLVLTRARPVLPPGVRRLDDLAEILRFADAEDVWVIGGADVYAQTLPYATRLEITDVDVAVAGDRLAPRPGPDWTCDVGPWLRSRTGLRYRHRSLTRAPRPDPLGLPAPEPGRLGP